MLKLSIENNFLICICSMGQIWLCFMLYLLESWPYGERPSVSRPGCYCTMSVQSSVAAVHLPVPRDENREQTPYRSGIWNKIRRLILQQNTF